ncbi:unnamed protein product [Amoebophrya sp. A25]|nr:unnamed protein product [Amoebophrya sp. A25]|eukprot:GSA25T00003683001.1
MPSPPAAASPSMPATGSSPSSGGAGVVAFITGGGRGIGRAIGERLIASGYRVAFADRAVYEENKLKDDQRKLQVLDLVCDVTDRASLETAFADTEGYFGAPAQILVCCAGLLSGTRFLDIEPGEWSKLLGVNLDGVFNTAQIGIKRMLAQDPPADSSFYGRVIVLASQAGRSQSKLGGAHYMASKAGVIGLTRSIAGEFGRRGITANAVCPGVIDSDMSRGAISKLGGGSGGDSSPTKIEDFGANIPVGRVGTPSDVASLANFLASPESSFITGACLDINGGNLML